MFDFKNEICKKRESPKVASTYAYWAWGGFALNVIVALCA